MRLSDADLVEIRDAATRIFAAPQPKHAAAMATELLELRAALARARDEGLKVLMAHDPGEGVVLSGFEASAKTGDFARAAVLVLADITRTAAKSLQETP